MIIESLNIINTLKNIIQKNNISSTAARADIKREILKQFRKKVFLLTFYIIIIMLYVSTVWSYLFLRIPSYNSVSLHLQYFHRAI